ncbi:beta-carotene hydroxylase [Altererythrobacter salegens]|uniref:Beta-carotene hydroxylase n=1 Tax=Croceibacterium salegens TaxID=1737568 RepID=A0A6I4SZI8_9SPHN|nr:fatty acid desaturase [Croceibacterium salegens]MXO60216.1 beta-carotene hydroxylase [Croceibacterium salegens]
MDRPIDDLTREETHDDLPLGGEAGLIEGGVESGAADRSAFEWRKAPELDRHVRIRLRKDEREIAARWMADPKQMRIYTVVTLGCFAFWVALFPLCMMDIVPLWFGFAFSTFIAAVGYVPSHEAMHHNIGRLGTKYHFWNEAVGQVATLILIFPFSMARLMHMHHHYHCNHPENDPDYTDGADNWWKAWIKTWLNRQPGADGSIHHYKRCLERIGTPEAHIALRDTMLLQLGSMFFMFALCWSGYAFEAAFLFWLPRHLGLSYIRYWLSWAPHHPRDGLDRYTNTRVFRTWVGHWMSLGMQYHIVHHLYPGIPNHATKYAYYEMKPILEARGVDCTPL